MLRPAPVPADILPPPNSFREMNEKKSMKEKYSVIVKKKSYQDMFRQQFIDAESDQNLSYVEERVPSTLKKPKHADNNIRSSGNTASLIS